MQNQPFKICPNCGQHAVLNMVACGRCGRPFSVQRRTKKRFWAVIVCIGLALIGFIGTIKGKELRDSSNPLVSVHFDSPLQSVLIPITIKNISGKPLEFLIMEVDFDVPPTLEAPIQSNTHFSTWLTYEEPYKNDLSFSPAGNHYDVKQVFRDKNGNVVYSTPNDMVISGHSHWLSTIPANKEVYIHLSPYYVDARLGYCAIHPRYLRSIRFYRIRRTSSTPIPEHDSTYDENFKRVEAGFNPFHDTWPPDMIRDEVPFFLE